MKKFVKLSLVAAVAVAGLTTTASAQSASDAIKNVSVKGYLQYRWDRDTGVNSNAFGAGSADRNRFRLQATAKANDTVALTVRVSSDKGVNADIDRKFITVTAGSAKIIAGTFADATPFTDQTRVDGEAVIYNAAKGLTLIGAYYHTNTNTSTLATSTQNIYGAGIVGNAGMLSYQAWYAQKDNYRNNNNSALGYTFASVKAKVAGINAELSYTGANGTATSLKKQSQTRLMVSGKVANFSAKAGLVKVGKDGANVVITNGAGTAVGDFESDKFNTSDFKTLNKSYTGTYAKIGAALTSQVGMSLQYFKIGKAKDLGLKITYKIAKNTSSYVRYNTGYKIDTTAATTTTNSGTIRGAKMRAVRVEFKYSF